MQETLAALKKTFPSLSEETATGAFLIAASDIKKACQFLKEKLSFNELACITAIDYKDKFALVYNLYSYTGKEKAALKVLLDKNSPSVESITSLWQAADWHEREAFDMMGITFNNHPDLRRILLPDDWTGYPLRKDYMNENLVRMPAI